VKFETTPAFDVDVRRLKAEHLAQFRDVVVTRFAPSCDAWAAATDAGGAFIWPKALRTHPMKGRPGVWEMTWSFASPDGRATFEFVRIGQEWRCRWRRVGDHGVYADP